MGKLSMIEVLNDPLIRDEFIKDAGIKRSHLEDILRMKDTETLISCLADDHTVFSYATESGYCEVIAWRGYYFSGSEWDPLDGPFESLDKALDPLRYLLECGDEVDTDSATHNVSSRLPDEDTFRIIHKLVSLGDVVEVNGTKYRRSDSGYAKE